MRVRNRSSCVQLIRVSLLNPRRPHHRSGMSANSCKVISNHVQIFENIDDDQLLSAVASVRPGSQLMGCNSPTNLSTALHVLASRQLESEIQEKILGKTFITHSDDTFAWRANTLEKLKDWNRRSKTSSRPSQKGYVSLGWLKMIHYYNLVMLYRPTRSIAQGVAGDLSVQACCQALILFRRFQMAKEIAQPWPGVYYPPLSILEIQSNPSNSS